MRFTAWRPWSALGGRYMLATDSGDRLEAKLSDVVQPVVSLDDVQRAELGAEISLELAIGSSTEATFIQVPWLERWYVHRITAQRESGDNIVGQIRVSMRMPSAQSILLVTVTVNNIESTYNADDFGILVLQGGSQITLCPNGVGTAASTFTVRVMGLWEPMALPPPGRTAKAQEAMPP